MKLPTIERPLITEPVIANALERDLAPYTGKSLERRQQAIRQTHASGVVGTIDQLLAAYRAAMDRADPKGVKDD
jgi:hypothetical protein